MSPRRAELCATCGHAERDHDCKRYFRLGGCTVFGEDEDGEVCACRKFVARKPKPRRRRITIHVLGDNGFETHRVSVSGDTRVRSERGGK